MKFSGKMCLKKRKPGSVKKNRVSSLSLEDIFFKKPQWGVRRYIFRKTTVGGQTAPPSPIPRSFRIKGIKQNIVLRVT